MLDACAAPVALRHRWQWQCANFAKGDSIWKRTVPHRQLPDSTSRVIWTPVAGCLTSKAVGFPCSAGISAESLRVPPARRAAAGCASESRRQHSPYSREPEEGFHLPSLLAHESARCAARALLRYKDRGGMGAVVETCAAARSEYQGRAGFL